MEGRTLGFPLPPRFEMRNGENTGPSAWALRATSLLLPTAQRGQCSLGSWVELQPPPASIGTLLQPQGRTQRSLLN